MSRKQVVLLVDDVQDSLSLFARILHHLIPGLETLTATNGADALLLVERHAVDAVVLDVRMPGMDGYEVCRRLKQNPSTAIIPVLMVSGVMTGARDRVAGIESGADGYLCKPFEPDEFAAMVRSLLRIRAAEDRLREHGRELQAELARRTSTLQQSEEQFRAVFEHSPDAIIVQAEDGVVLDVNAAACRLHGLPKAELIGSRVWELVPAEERERVRDLAGRWFDGSLTYAEGFVQRGSNEPVPVEVTGNIMDYQGRRAILLMVRDTQRRMLAEIALRKSESRYRAMVEDLSDLICRRSRDGSLLFANPALGRFVGRDPDLLVGTSLFDFIPAGEHARITAYLAALRPASPVSRIDHLMHSTDGRMHWIQWIDHGIFDEKGVLVEIQSAGRDITEQKLSQERQTLTSIWLRVVIDMADQLIACADLVGMCRRAVELTRTHLGLERCSILLDSDGVLHGSFSADGDGNLVDERGSRQTPPDGWSDFCRNRDGQDRPWIEVAGPLSAWTGSRRVALEREGLTAWTPIQSASRCIGAFVNDNAVTGAPLDAARQEILAVFCSLLGNMIERKEVDADRARLVAAIDQSAECIMVLDPARTVRYVNQVFSRMFGPAPETLLDHHPRLPGPDGQLVDLFADIWPRVLGGEIWTGRLRMTNQAGQSIETDQTVSPVRDSAGHVVQVIATIQDVTRGVRMEAELRQAQKMEMVGRMAGGISHDFNNLLTGILGFSRLIAEDLGPNHPATADVREVIAAGERAARLTQRLLAFSRKNVPALRPLDLNAILVSINPLLRRTLGKSVELAVELGPGLGPIEGDPDQLEQILMNLSINARDAMPGGGTLVFCTSAVDLDAAAAELRKPLQQGPHIQLIVRDNGAGMSPEVLSHIFEPFYTTKDAGKGSGLGLSTVYAITQQLRGFIEVKSEPGKGTEFRLLFPKSPRALAEELGAPAKDVSPGGRETILVVEDEASVRHLTVRCLEALGYRVHTAMHGSEALRKMEELASAVDLIVTDVVMPVMGGPELVSRLRLKHPLLPVVYVSGFMDETAGAQISGALAGPLLQKPFTREELAAAVRKALDT